MDTATHGLRLDDLPKPASSQTLFANDNPLVVELGSGKGSFLVAESVQQPETNFLGIEKTLRFWRFGADRLRRQGCTNARLIHGDAAVLVRDALGLESVTEMHVYFPDPWPKRKQHQRRLVQAEFLTWAYKKLEAGGRLQIVTDHRDYFEQIERLLENSRLTPVDYIRPESATSGEIAGTNFERKYLKEGRAFHAIAAVKRAGN